MAVRPVAVLVGVPAVEIHAAFRPAHRATLTTDTFPLRSGHRATEFVFLFGFETRSISRQGGMCRLDRDAAEQVGLVDLAFDGVECGSQLRRSVAPIRAVSLQLFKKVRQ